MGIRKHDILYTKWVEVYLSLALSLYNFHSCFLSPKFTLSHSISLFSLSLSLSLPLSIYLSLSLSLSFSFILLISYFFSLLLAMCMSSPPPPSHTLHYPFIVYLFRDFAFVTRHFLRHFIFSTKHMHD